MPSWPTRDQSTFVTSAKYVFAVAAAEILVCRLSQSEDDHVTLIPVALVNASRSACGGGSVGSATVMVTPEVCVDPPVAAGVPPPPLLHAAVRSATAVSPAAPCHAARDRLVVMVLGPPLGPVHTRPSDAV